MEVEKLNDFLQNCCRICLAIENEMVDSSNIVENFSKSIDQLLLECADMKVMPMAYFESFQIIPISKIELDAER